MRYFLDLMYDGTSFSGWQRQENAISVQQCLEEALSQLFGKETPIMGSGRTDAGVHALHQVAHVDFESDLTLNQLNYKLNAILPSSIAVNSIRPVLPDAHARFSAEKRGYTYKMHRIKDPFVKGYSYKFSHDLDESAIQKALAVLLEWRDFESFSKVQTDVNHFECEIFSAEWNTDHRSYVFQVQANRFLRGMVRTMVGTLLDVGMGKLTPEDVHEILKKKDRRAASRSVPACGLFLSEVKYPNNLYLD